MPASSSTPVLRERLRPPAVPSAARAVLEDLTVGTAAAPQGGATEGLHIFYSLKCANGVLIIATTHEVVYAELPCDRSPPDSALHLFFSSPVQIRFVAGYPSKLFLESKTAGTIEFTVPGIWIETR